MGKRSARPEPRGTQRSVREPGTKPSAPWTLELPTEVELRRLTGISSFCQRYHHNLARSRECECNCANMANFVETLDHQLATILADCSVLTTFIALVIVAFVAYPAIYQL